MLKYFRPVIRTRHPSHQKLRRRNREKVFPLFPFKSVIRFGSTTDIKDTITNGGNRVEINTIESIRKSSNKLKMKDAFRDAGVITAEWYTSKEGKFLKENTLEGELITAENLPFPIVAKKHYGSRNNGNVKIDNLVDFAKWAENKDLSKFIFEKFHNFVREYRLHVTEAGCFYTCRKMLKADTPEEHKWYRNDNHCVWIMEDNELFDKPVNWKEIEEHSIKALKSVGLDIGAVDVKIQSSVNPKGNKRKKCQFIILEINSAPSFGEVTEQKYIDILPTILETKHLAIN